MDATTKLAMDKQAMNTLTKALIALGVVGATATPYSPLEISINKRYGRRPVASIPGDLKHEFGKTSSLAFDDEIEKLAFMQGFRDTISRYAGKLSKGAKKAKAAKAPGVGAKARPRKKPFKYGKEVALASGVALGAAPFVVKRMSRVEKAAALLTLAMENQMEKDASFAWVDKILGRAVRKGGKKAANQFLGKGGKWLLGATLFGAPLAYMGHQKGVRDAYAQGQYAGSAQIAALMQAMQGPQGGLNFNNRIGRS